MDPDIRQSPPRDPRSISFARLARASKSSIDQPPVSAIAVAVKVKGPVSTRYAQPSTFRKRAADAFAGFNGLYESGTIHEAACWPMHDVSFMACTRQPGRPSQPRRLTASRRCTPSRIVFAGVRPANEGSFRQD